MLRGSQAVYAATVLEDCVDELNILGSIMPYSYESKHNAIQMVSDEIQDVIETQRDIEERYNQAMLARTGVLGCLPGDILEAQQEIMAASTDLKGGNNLMSKAMRQNPLTPDNLEKVQEDRNFLEQVMRIAYKELLESGSFESLQQAVASEEEKKQELQQIIVREENSRLRIKELRRQIEDIVKEKEAEVQARTEMIAHLKDVYQETKAKTGMEMKYVSKTCTVNVEQTANKCNLSEGQLREEIEQLKKFTDQETRVNAETESWLRTHCDQLEKKMDGWNSKLKQDVEDLQHRLDVLKQSKLKDLQKLETLTKTYKEYEAVVIEDRIEKEKERRRKEQEAIELGSALKVSLGAR
uniref:Dynein regulatory complex protein 9 n=1 Tax=Macrostomum lignano TaxID=282301 RepID=A0A1I8HNS5_9PLAT